jgi:GDP-fucose transporter C1
VVTLGFFVGIFLDATPIALLGIAFGIASSAITAVHSVVIKKSLDVVNGSAMHLSWYTNLLSAVLMIPLIVLVGEVPAITSLFFGPYDIVSAPGELSELHTFVWGSAITVRTQSVLRGFADDEWTLQGVIGFLMSLASLLSIKVTSPITHMVSSAVRGVAASLLGMWLFGDVISTQVFH